MLRLLLVVLSMCAMAVAQSQGESYKAATREEAAAQLTAKVKTATTKGKLVLMDISGVERWAGYSGTDLNGKDKELLQANLGMLRKSFDAFHSAFNDVDGVYKANVSLFDGEGQKSFAGLMKPADDVAEQVTAGMNELREKGISLDSGAQEPQTPPSNSEGCPAKAVDAYTNSIYHRLTLQVANNGDKKIDAVKLKAVFIDAVGDEHRATWDYIMHDIGAHTKMKRDFDENLYDSHPGVRVWPIKVVFKDGTTWAAQGDECAATFTHK